MEELLHGLLLCHSFYEASELHRAQHECLLPVPDVAPGPRAVCGLWADRRELQHQSARPACKQPAIPRTARHLSHLSGGHQARQQNVDGCFLSLMQLLDPMHLKLYGPRCAGKQATASDRPARMDSVPWTITSRTGQSIAALLLRDSPPSCKGMREAMHCRGTGKG